VRGFKGFTPLVVIGIAGLAWLLFVSEPGSHWLTAFLAPPPASGAVVGRLIRGEGGIKRVHGGDVQKLDNPITSPVELHDGDRIETDQGAQALMVLNSQDEIAIPPLSAVSVQLWNEQDPASALYLQVLAGDVELKKAGVRGRAYVVRDGRLYLPGQKPVKKALALTVLRSAPLDMQLAENQAGTASDFETDNSAAALPEESTASSGMSAEPETLSNEYIDEMMTSRQSQLQKCWLSRLKEKPDLKGQIVLQFEITRHGKVKDAKVADTTLNDDSLQKCVISVVERIAFRGFKGPEISLSYPINFE
jgi:hypothetical protein